MIRVYIAGPITPTGNHAHPGIEFMTNIRRGIRAAVDLVQRGYAVFCPFIDYQYLLVLDEWEELESKHFYKSSMAYLEVSEAVLVLPGWSSSKGTCAEMDRAKELGLPIFHSLDSLDYYFQEQNGG